MPKHQWIEKMENIAKRVILWFRDFSERTQSLYLTQTPHTLNNFRFLYVFLLICIPYYLSGQNQEAPETDNNDATGEDKRVSFIAIPLVFYLPETRLGFGGASNLSLHWKNQDRSERPSQFTIGAAYTLNEQLLTYVSYNIYLPGETFWFRGELGYYDYVYQFFGTGQDRAPENANFFSKYPRLKVDALRQIQEDVFFGLSYRFDDYQITSIDDPEGIFGDVANLNGGITSGLGVAGVVDTRDIINYPRKGMLFELSVLGNNEAIGADFEYVSVNTSFSKYIPIRNNVLALNFNSTNIFGEAPFYELAQFGGGKRSRGYIEGEYRADHSFAFQAEYRLRFQKLKRFGAVVFASIGQVFDDTEELGFENALPAFGGGIRYLLSVEQNLNLRADAGFGINGLQFYVTFAEAF